MSFLVHEPSKLNGFQMVLSRNSRRVSVLVETVRKKESISLKLGHQSCNGQRYRLSWYLLQNLVFNRSNATLQLLSFMVAFPWKKKFTSINLVVSSKERVIKSFAFDELFMASVSHHGISTSTSLNTWSSRG
jgi:hypothetical protein